MLDRGVSLAGESDAYGCGGAWCRNRGGRGGVADPAQGRSVALIDRKPPGEETSFGNAGLIQREAYYPYAFPRGFAKLLKYGLNGESEAHYHLGALPRIAWPLLQYWLNAAPARVERTIRVNRPLFENCLSEHELLAAEAGATDLLRPGGWIQVYRKQESLGARLEEAERLRRDFGVSSTRLDGASLQAIEPHLRNGEVGGRDPLA